MLEGRRLRGAKKDNMKYKFLFLRHGRSLADDEAKHEGRYDSPLTEVGIQQAENTAEKLKTYNFDLIISSPLKRALKTSEIISSKLGVKIEINDLLKERDNGVLAGLTFSEARIKYPEPTYQNIYRNFPEESGENEIQLYSRALLCINSIIKKKPGNYLIVSHGTILNAIIKQILKVPIGNNVSSAIFRLKDNGFIEMDYDIEKDLWIFSKLESGN